MRKFCWVWLALLVLIGCGDEFPEDEVAANVGKEIVWEKDSKEMVLIPSGSFRMGDHFEEGETDELPVRTIELDAFYMDVHEVTVGQFKLFLEDSGYDYGNWDGVAKYSPTDDHPMVNVSWHDVTAYAKWAGKRLSTEAEWEYAARGGLVGKRYPWGDEVTHDDANYDGTGGKDKWEFTAPVGSFGANGYGLYDMAGNVWEWCQDWYGEDHYQSSVDLGLTENPLGPDTGSVRVLRGGSWSYAAYFLRLAYRDYLNSLGRSLNRGFRCVSGLNQ